MLNHARLLEFLSRWFLKYVDSSKRIQILWCTRRSLVSLSYDEIIRIVFPVMRSHLSQIIDYERCVALVTKAALREMRIPGLLCVITPILVGLTFRFVGEYTNRPLLGAEVLAAYLMFGTVTGILMALFLDTAGGAWDNVSQPCSCPHRRALVPSDTCFVYVGGKAKKWIELGHFGGKGSDAHKASVTGDTVGDPFVSPCRIVLPCRICRHLILPFSNSPCRKIRRVHRYMWLSSFLVPPSLLRDLCLSRTSSNDI